MSDMPNLNYTCVKK